MAKYIGETTEYDKKQEVERRKVKSWLKSVSAFANGSGGCLLFGIADDDTIIGLTDAKTDAEFISQKIKERIDPMPQIDLKIERVEDKELLILHVHGGEDTPYYYIGTPSFDKVTLNLENGRKFILSADRQHMDDYLIQSVTLNGKPLADYRLSHQQILNGGELLFDMQ